MDHHAQVPAVCLNHVSFAYRGRSVVENADFDIFKGESVCVIGPNGGGKTTLLRLMLGLLSPDQGSVTLLGGDPVENRSRVGYVPQQIEADPLFPVTAMEVVLTGTLKRGCFGFVSKAERVRAFRALDEMGLAEVADQTFGSLSGGQRQGVLIARALAGEPELLLLDEPTAHVDVAVEARLVEALQRLHEQMTVITVSHDLAFVSRSVPKVVCVHRHVHVHPTAELTHERINQLYGFELRMIQHTHDHDDCHGGHQHA